MIFVAYEKNTFEVIYVMMCPDEKQARLIFEKFILPNLDYNSGDVESTVIDLSSNLSNLIK